MTSEREKDLFPERSPLGEAIRTLALVALAVAAVWWVITTRQKLSQERMDRERSTFTPALSAYWERQRREAEERRREAREDMTEAVQEAIRREQMKKRLGIYPYDDP